jgi:surface protein
VEHLCRQKHDVPSPLCHPPLAWRFLPSCSICLSSLTFVPIPRGMFWEVQAFNGNLSAWNTAAVTNMRYPPICPHPACLPSPLSICQSSFPPVPSSPCPIVWTFLGLLRMLITRCDHADLIMAANPRFFVLILLLTCTTASLPSALGCVAVRQHRPPHP